MEEWSTNELKSYLDEKAEQYEKPFFLDADPLGLLHRFSTPIDQEIFGLLIATIAWGNRASIIKSGENLIQRLDNSPYEVIKTATEKEINSLAEGFVHRTFNADDLVFFCLSLQRYYTEKKSLEQLFSPGMPNLNHGIVALRSFFLQTPHQQRSQKHLADVTKNSAAKRLHLYLRWMVRSSQKGVDLGIWKTLSASQLSCPLDVHSGRIARSLGLIHRQQNDQKTLEELDKRLRIMDPNDPVKYDFALFGIGAFEFVSL
ncbi:MAG: TIGR02757 family protein [Flavobacteriaceae bacterium]